MHLENLNLVHFKNYEQLRIDFSKDINCFVGDNGSGKTNLLDAIHYLSATRSAFNSVDQQVMQHEKDFFSVIGVFEKNDDREKVRCSLVKGERKKIFWENTQLEKASDHVGRFPAVMIAPNDTSLITEGSETRRRFFDSMIAQFDREYLDHLIQYNHALRQRNELIRQFAEKNKVEYDRLEPYDELITGHSQGINQKRKEFCQEFVPLLSRHYQNLTENKETISLKYLSPVSEEDFVLNFKNSLKKDIALQRTTLGAHRDDFLFEIDGYPLKKFGSQGQQKSYIIAVKLAQFDVLREKKGYKPLLLLDDIFDKLDDSRIGKLVKMVNDHSFGQVFITDARPERTMHYFSGMDTEIRVFTIMNGEIIESANAK